MSNTLNPALSSIFNENMSDIKAIMEKDAGSISIEEAQEIAELGIFLNTFINKVNLSELEKGYIKSWIAQIVNILGEKSYKACFSLYYFNRDAKKDLIGIVKKTIPQIMILKGLKTLGYNPNPKSVFDTIVHEIPRLIPIIERVFDEQSDKSFRNLWFLILNILDYLYLIKDENAGSLNNEFDRFKKFVGEHVNLLQDSFKNLSALESYAYGVQGDYGIDLGAKVIPLNDLKGKSLPFQLIRILAAGGKNQSENIKGTYDRKLKHLFWVIEAWSSFIPKYGEVGVIPFFIKIDSNIAFEIVWGSTGSLSREKLTNDEIKTVRNFYDEDIRGHLYKYFTNHKFVPLTEKSRLENERSKANAGGEIADFNVDVEFGDYNRRKVCIPIKSGRELLRKNADKISVEYEYQMVKPLANFPGKSLVFAIIIADITVNANELFSQIRTNLELPIYIIDTRTYGQFLKREKIIS